MCVTSADTRSNWLIDDSQMRAWPRRLVRQRVYV
jgi:hypothetical protein